MLEHLKAQDAIELKKKLEAAIEIATLHHIDPCVIHLLRKELESFAFMTANIEHRVVMRTTKQLATEAETLSSKWIRM